MLDIFRKYQAKIIDLVQPMVDRLLEKTYSEKLISFNKKDDILTTQGDTQYSKASNILHEVDRTLQHASSLVEVRCTLLIFVCKVLQSLNDPGLTRFANEFMVELKEGNNEKSIIADSSYTSWCNNSNYYYGFFAIIIQFLKLLLCPYANLRLRR